MKCKSIVSAPEPGVDKPQSELERHCRWWTPSDQELARLQSECQEVKVPTDREARALALPAWPRLVPGGGALRGDFGHRHSTAATITNLCSATAITSPANNRARAQASLSVGTFMPAALVPAGLLAELREVGLLRDDVLPVFLACVLSVLDELTDDGLSERDEYRLIGVNNARTRYGRPHVEGKRPWVWDNVRRGLLDARVIEVESSATSSETYTTKDGDGHRKGRPKGYRLVQRWRDVVDIEEVVRGPGLWVPDLEYPKPEREDGSQVEIDVWLERCVWTVEYDLEAGYRSTCEMFGAVVPETIDFASCKAAIMALKAEDVPAAVLADIEATRRTRPPKSSADWRVDSDGRYVKINKDGELELVLLNLRDERPAVEIAKARALSRLINLRRWRVDGVCNVKRDAAGHRLHSPVTRLAEDLRGFLSFNGEHLVGIDAKNSQMCLLAAAVREVSNAPDAIDFQQVCAEGRFYEESFYAVHGRYPSPEERQAWKSTVMGAWLYAYCGCMANSDIGQALAKRWPTVHAWMWQQKWDCGVRDLPCRMQRREAMIWVDQLGPELEAIGCPGLTVHDSVYVPVSRVAEARAIVERLHAAAGVRVKLA